MDKREIMRIIAKQRESIHYDWSPNPNPTKDNQPTNYKP